MIKNVKYDNEDILGILEEESGPVCGTEGGENKRAQIRKKLWRK